MQLKVELSQERCLVNCKESRRGNIKLLLENQVFIIFISFIITTFKFVPLLKNILKARMLQYN